MSLKIIPTTLSHLQRLARIGREQWPHENWITEAYLKITVAKKGIHYTALLNKAVVGSIMAVEEDYPKFWIHYLVVDKNYRRKGIGTALLKKIESKLAKGAFLLVDLEKNDRTGLAFYKKNGFLIQGKVKNWFEGREGIIFGKKI